MRGSTRKGNGLTITSSAKVEREVRRDVEESMRRTGTLSPQTDEPAEAPTLQVNVGSCKFSTVHLSATLCGYSVTEDERWWDLLWMDHTVSRDRVLKMMPFQRINHFPGMLEICRKLPLARLMRRMSSALPEEFAFHPSTWLLPDEMPLFLQALHRAQTRLLGVSSRPGDIHAGSRSHYLLARDIYLAGSLDVGVDRALNGPPPPMVSFRSSFPRRFDLPDHLALPSSRTRIRLPTYIIKPSSGAMGRNIALVQLPEHIPADSTVFEGGVAQQYVDRPLLVDGRKFDCRVYVLVRSVWPLEIHVFQEGLARLASIPYRAPDLKNIGKQTMHLTNYSINKKEAADVSRSDDPITGCKRLITDVFRRVCDVHNQSKPEGSEKMTPDMMWRGIEDLAVKTLLSIHPHLAHTYCCAALAAPTRRRRRQTSRDSSPAPSGNAPSHARPRSKGGQQITGKPGRQGSGSESREAAQGEAGATGAAPLASDSCCFEVLGFDVLFDESFKPWLVEINHSPSFSADTLLDQTVKTCVLSETMAILQQEAASRLTYFTTQNHKRRRRLYGDPAAAARAQTNATGRKTAAASLAEAFKDIDRMIGELQPGGDDTGTKPGAAAEAGPATGAKEEADDPDSVSTEAAVRARRPATGALFRMAAAQHFAELQKAASAVEAPEGDGARLLREVARERHEESVKSLTRAAHQVLSAKNAGRLGFKKVYPPAEGEEGRAAMYERVLSVAEHVYHARTVNGTMPCTCAACSAARNNQIHREIANVAARQAQNAVVAREVADPMAAEQIRAVIDPDEGPQALSKPLHARDWIRSQATASDSAAATAAVLSRTPSRRKSQALPAITSTAYTAPSPQLPRSRGSSSQSSKRDVFQRLSSRTISTRAFTWTRKADLDASTAPAQAPAQRAPSQRHSSQRDSLQSAGSGRPSSPGGSADTLPGRTSGASTVAGGGGDSDAAARPPSLDPEEAARAKARGAYFDPGMAEKGGDSPPSRLDSRRIGERLLERLEAGAGVDAALDEVLGTREGEGSRGGELGGPLGKGGGGETGTVGGGQREEHKVTGAPSHESKKGKGGGAEKGKERPPSRGDSGSLARKERPPSRGDSGSLARRPRSERQSRSHKGEGVALASSWMGLDDSHSVLPLSTVAELQQHEERRKRLVADFERHLGELNRVSKAALRQIGM